MFNESEAVGPVKRVTLKRPLNITQQQHWGQLSCQNQTTVSVNTSALTRTLSLSACWCSPLLSVPHLFSFFFQGCKMQMRRGSRLCIVSGETASQIQTSVWIAKHKVEDMRERVDREEGSSKVAGKASVPVFFCGFDWTKSYIHMNTSFYPLYFPSGYLF